MSRDDQDSFTLMVKDTGVGIPVGFDPTTTPTLGTQLVVDLTRQLKGTLEFHRAKGTEISITF
jgi:hypothetical protein